MVDVEKAVRELLELTMEDALVERLEGVRTVQGTDYDQRNGSYERSLLTSLGYLKSIRVPRARVASIAHVVLPKYNRTQSEFDAAVVGSFLLGHGARKSKRFFSEFLGEVGVSHTQVSRILSHLDERAGAWRSRRLEPWQHTEVKACIELRARVDRSLVFYQVANGPWLTHLKSTNLLERFFRKLKRFEKSRQFRYADKRSCTRFYDAYPLEYNQRFLRMPHLS